MNDDVMLLGDIYKFKESVGDLRPFSSGYKDDVITSDEMENTEVKLEDLHHSIDIKEEENSRILDYQQNSNEKIMSFKIVETFERGTTVLSTVPSQWEVDGILYWPRTASLRLQQDPMSVPDKDSWPPVPCTVKRRGILSLKEALSIEKEMSGDFEDDFHHQKRIRASNPLIKKTNHQNKRRKLAQPSANKSTDDYLFNVEEYAGTSLKVNNSLTGINGDRLESSPRGHYEVSRTEKSVNNSAQALLNVLEDRLTALENSIADMKNSMNSQFQSVHNTLNGIKILHQKLLSTAALDVSEDSPSPNETNFDSIKEILKVDSKEALDSLEEKLKDSTFSALFVQYMSQICGTSGNKVAKRCRYMIFDHLFDRKLIAVCSWTGISRKKQKINFSQYKRLLEILFQVLKLADRKFERSHMKDTCFGILHNSTSRLKHENQRKKD